MAEYFDRLEARDPAEREAEQFARFPTFLRQALAVAPGLRRWLDGVNPDAVTNREALARLPVLRKAELMEM